MVLLISNKRIKMGIFTKKVGERELNRAISQVENRMRLACADKKAFDRLSTSVFNLAKALGLTYDPTKPLTWVKHPFVGRKEGDKTAVIEVSGQGPDFEGVLKAIKEIAENFELKQKGGKKLKVKRGVGRPRKNGKKAN